MIVMIIVMFLVYVLFSLLCVTICRCTKYNVPTTTWSRVRALKISLESSVLLYWPTKSNKPYKRTLSLRDRG